jgi:hypothetical protein
MKTQIKTIDIQVKEWRDKTYGNTYFAAIVAVNYGMEDEREYKLPFQYGYGDHAKNMAYKELQKVGEINEPNGSFWQYCKDNNIITRFTVKENCLQRELKNI